MAKRGVHDMGGLPAGPVDRHEHTPTLVERRIDAMMQLLRAKPRSFWKTDENRRTLESLAPETYNSYGYYARWTLGMRSLLVEKGILTDAEVDAKLAEVMARHGKKPVAAKQTKAKPAKPAPAAKKSPAKAASAKKTAAAKTTKSQKGKSA